MLSAPEWTVTTCITRPIQFIEQEVAVRHRIRCIWHVEVVVEGIQTWWLRRWQQHSHADPLLLWVLCGEPKIDRLLVLKRVAIGWQVGKRCCLWLRNLRWLGTLSCVLATTALSPARGTVVLHDGWTVATSAAVQTALLANGAWVLVCLIITGPAVKVECGLHVGRFVGRSGDGCFERVQMCVLHEWVAKGKVLSTFKRRLRRLAAGALFYLHLGFLVMRQL
jgi:hypothetical protein